MCGICPRRVVRLTGLGSSTSWVLLLGAVGWACARQPTKYPTWEPTSELVPAVRDRKLALADLERSRALWHEQNPASYSYVRALQASSEDVEFTLVVVRDSVVVERAFLASRSDLDGLGDRMAGKKGHAPRLLWRERGREIGAHE